MKGKPAERPRATSVRARHILNLALFIAGSIRLMKVDTEVNVIKNRKKLRPQRIGPQENAQNIGGYELPIIRMQMPPQSRRDSQSSQKEFQMQNKWNTAEKPRQAKPEKRWTTNGHEGTYATTLSIIIKSLSFGEFLMTESLSCVSFMVFDSTFMPLFSTCTRLIFYIIFVSQVSFSSNLVIITKSLVLCVIYVSISTTSLLHCASSQSPEFSTIILANLASSRAHYSDLSFTAPNSVIISFSS